MTVATITDEMLDELSNRWSWLRLDQFAARNLFMLAKIAPNPVFFRSTSIASLEYAAAKTHGLRHYFDSDTLEFFGSKDRQLVAHGAYIERQTNAPDESLQWVVTAFVYPDGEDNEDLIAWTIGRWRWRSQAVSVAEALVGLLVDARLIFEEAS